MEQRVDQQHGSVERDDQDDVRGHIILQGLALPIAMRVGYAARYESGIWYVEGNGTLTLVDWRH